MRARLTLRNTVAGRSVQLRLLRRIVLALLRELPQPVAELGIYLIAEKEMIRLNETFVRHRGSTDVITFDYREPPEIGALSAEIFVCLDEARLQAARFRAPWQHELVRYIVHGLLHLNGYNDRRPGPRAKMKRQENRLLKKLAREFHLQRLGTTSGKHRR